MASFEEEYIFDFSCDFDRKKNRWWFEDSENERMFFVSGDVIPEDYDCDQATEELIESHLKVIFPTYDFYRYQTNHNGRICNPETGEFYPSYAFTIMVFYHKPVEKPKKPEIKEGYFSFSCDYDFDKKRWWFKNEDETFYIESEQRMNGFECDYVTKELINRFLKPKYPTYDFYRYHTNMNAQIYNSETDTYYPSYQYTVLVNFRYIQF